MRLLVTGGCGFIGSCLVRHVLDAEPSVEVVNLDALTYAATEGSLRHVRDDPRYRFVHGDVRDAALVDGLVADADAVVHLAAESHVDRSIEGPRTFLDTNVVGAGVVFDACRRHGVERVVHVSTDEVYGSVPAPGVSHEDDPLRPRSPYAASKAAADLLARSYATTYGYPITVTRSTNNLGPFQFPEKLVALFVTNLLDGGSVPLYGDGGNVRDWIHVSDHAAAIWLVLTAGEPGRTYNVGAGNERTNRALTEAILARFGIVGDAVDERITLVADRPGHDRRYAVDATRLRALGWSPTGDLDDALDRTIAWYRDNEWWWRPLRAAGATERRGLLG